MKTDANPSNHARSGQPVDDGYWSSVRADFPTTEKFVYLDGANKGILPRCAETAARDWFEDIFEHAGEDAFLMESVYEARDAMAQFVGVPQHTLAFIKNTSEGINIVAGGVGLKEGDNVLLSELEHANNGFPWRHLERQGVEVRRVRPNEDGRVPPENYESRADRHTKLIAVSWVAYGNGFRADIPRLSTLCRDIGAFLVVDGIQAVGTLSMPLQTLGADVLVCGGHKGLYSPAGAGIMYVREEMIRRITPPYAAKWSFTTLDWMQHSLDLREDCQRFEYGSPNALGIAIQRRTTDYLRQIGLANIEARIRELTTYLIEAGDDLGFKIHTPRAWGDRASIVSFDIGGDAELIAQELRRQSIIVSPTLGRIRASVNLYNNKEDLNAFLEALLKVSKSKLP